MHISNTTRSHGTETTPPGIRAERLADLLREIEARALESRLDGLGELVEEAEAGDVPMKPVYLMSTA